MRVPRSVLAAVLLCAAPVAARAACPTGPSGQNPSPTIVSVSPGGGTYMTGQTITVTYELCDYPQWDIGNRSITWNGVASSAFATDSYETDPASGLIIGGRISGTLTIAAGTNTLTLLQCDGNTCASRTTTYTGTGISTSLRPLGGYTADTVWNAADTRTSRKFQVTNTTSVSRSYTFSTDFNNTLNLVATPASATIAAGATLEVEVAYTTMSPGTFGAVQLYATSTAGGGDVNNSYFYVVMGNAQALVTVDSATGPDRIRGDCLHLPAALDGVNQCGDLRLAHALPSVRTMGEVRTPTLLYNSDLAQPFPVVQADVRLDHTVGLTGVTAKLWVYLNGTTNRVEKATRTYAASDWGSGGTRRIGLGFDASGMATGIYGYEVEVTASYSSGAQPPARIATGELPIVYRWAYFGRGWWLAGLEQIQYVAPTNVTAQDRELLIMGDGSTRTYVYQGTLAGTNKLYWLAPAYDRPDTLWYSPDSAFYWRTVENGTRVKFHGAGQHTETVNRRGHRTRFAYDGAGRMTTLEVPAGAGWLTYDFRYENGGLISRVIAPGARQVTINAIGSGSSGVWPYALVDAITDPDLKGVGFSYDANSFRIGHIRDRRQQSQFFSYGGDGRLVDSRVGAHTAPLIRYDYCAAQSTGVWGGCRPSATPQEQALTLYDGPQTDTTDRTRFWLDRYGAPLKIRNALGHVSTIGKYDARFPGLATIIEPPRVYRRLS